MQGMAGTGRGGNVATLVAQVPATVQVPQVSVSEAIGGDGGDGSGDVPQEPESKPAEP